MEEVGPVGLEWGATPSVALRLAFRRTLAPCVPDFC